MGDIWWDISYTGDISGQKSQTFEISLMWEPKKLEISQTIEIFHEISHCMWESPKFFNNCYYANVTTKHTDL